MLGLLMNITKAAVAVAITPVAIVVDIVRIPETSTEIHGEMFGLTGKLLKNAAKNINEATK